MAARRTGMAAVTQLLRASSIYQPCLHPAKFTSPRVTAPLSRLIRPAVAPKSWMQARAMSCCAGLGNPPPREIIVEYCEEGDHTEYFIKLADGIENAYPELVVLGNPEDMQSRKGSFEVRSGDSILFSKLETKRLPKLEEILRAIDSLPAHCEVGTAKEVNG